MTLSSPRMRDDPELRAAFVELDTLLVSYDLDQVRPPPPPPAAAGPAASAAPAAPEAPAPPVAQPLPSGALRVVVGVGGAIAAALLAWMWWAPTSPPDGALPLDVPAPAILEVAPPPAPAVERPVEASPLAPRPAEPSMEVASNVPRPPLAPEPAASAVVPDEVQPDEVQPISEDPPPTSVLAEENRLFDLATAALEQERFAEARDAITAYQAAFPDGRYQAEAHVHLLEASMELQDWATTEREAAILERDPDLAARAAEFRGARALALAHLGRCRDALALQDAGARAVTSELRRLCK